MDNIVIRSFKDIKLENESVKTGSEIYKISDGVGQITSEIEYDASYLKEVQKDGSNDPTN